MIECEFHLTNNTFVSCRLMKVASGNVDEQIAKALDHLWIFHHIEVPVGATVAVYANRQHGRDMFDHKALTVGTKI